MSFYHSVQYTPSNPDSGTHFDSLVPRSGGFIRLGPDWRAFSVAMFHELHCLFAINRALHGPESSYLRGHFTHCTNYLRQLFLCSADHTLEPGDFMSRNLSDHSNVFFNRQCRDWSAIYDFSETNIDEFRTWRTLNYSSAASHTS
ncbi:hypothetical protein SISNIDRAFT_450070 [Sistotremastrum niveocremeum HHB9708]|uniref:Oxidase ustYa n=1 Tax=Sistotremastrum niveocremeum HHB9708 TaxID=1314777 RepID=A0A164YVK0_9AGAM|nr:hypothetical protein SISNIDRAFT_450070 [Sistotremastrum niveocremeum HHB9708]